MRLENTSFRLFQVCPSQEYERKLHPDDLPLLVQRSWDPDTDCHFRVRRNPRAPPLPPRALPPNDPIEEEDEPSRALSALSLESDNDNKRYSPVYKFPSISYCRETKNDYLYIWLAVHLSRFGRKWCREHCKWRKVSVRTRKRLL